MDTTTLGLVVVASLLAVVALVGLRDLLARPRLRRQVPDAGVRRGVGDTHRHTGGATPQGIGGSGDGV